MIAKLFNNRKLIDALFVISTLVLIGYIIYVLINDMPFTAFHPVNLVWCLFLVLKLRLDTVRIRNRQKDRMF